MNDFTLAFLFWLTCEALSLPLRFALTPLGMSSDVRRLLSRIAGPVMLVLIAGLGAHGPVKPGTQTGWALVLLAGAGSLLFVLRTGGKAGVLGALVEALPIQRKSWKRDLALESVFFATFMGYVAFRRLAPEMTFEIQNSGAEKFPNAMLFWSCWHADRLPPEDYWFAGLPQTYYYWGHFFWSWIGHLGQFPATSVIALGLSRSVVFVGEASYLLLRALRLKWKAALPGALFIAWGGNPQTWVTLKQQYVYQLRLAGAEIGEGSLGRVKDFGAAIQGWNWSLYSFWEPSRVIKHTVNEFPAWSAVLGDFHAHHLALPWLIGWFAMVAGGDRWFLQREGGAAHRSGGILAGMTFIGLGTMACLANAWNLPIVLVACPVILLWRWPERRLPAGFILMGLQLLCIGLAIGFGGKHPLTPLGGGGGSWIERIPVRLLDSGLRSTESELLRLWGFQAGILVVALGAFCVRARGQGRVLAWVLLGGGFIASSLFILNGSTFQRDEPGLYWLGLGCWIVAMMQGKKPWLSARAAAAGAGACLLLAGLEFFYVRDRMTGELARYNSYFKFSYAAWPLLSASAWVSGARMWSAARPKAIRLALRAMLLLVIPASVIFLVFGMPARTLQARIGDDSPREATLDGFQWLKHRHEYEAEAAALEWIRAHVPPGDAIATAAAPSAYSYQGRVASLAGRRVPLGWGHHEAQWRGPGIYDALKERHEAVNAVFLAGDAEQMRQAAAELGVRWALLGKNELETFGAPAFGETRKIMGQAAELRAMFPQSAPEVFLYEFKGR